MADFSTSAELELVVSSRELRSARQTIEDGLGDISVGVDASSSGPASRNTGQTSRDSKRMMKWARSRTEDISDILTILQNIDEDISQSGDGGDGSRLPKRIKSLSLGGGALLGGLAIGAGMLVSKAATILPSDVIGSAANVTADILTTGKAVITAPDVIASGAAVTAGNVIQSKAAIGASDVISGGVSLAVGDVLGGPVTITASDVIAASVALATGDVVSSAAAIAAGDLVSSKAVISAGDVIAESVSISVEDILGAGAIGGGLYAAHRFVSGAGSAASGAARGVGAPINIPGLFLDELKRFGNQTFGGNAGPGTTLATATPMGAAGMNGQIDVNMGGITVDVTTTIDSAVDDAVSDIEQTVEREVQDLERRVSNALSGGVL